MLVLGLSVNVAANYSFIDVSAFEHVELTGARGRGISKEHIKGWLETYSHEVRDSPKTSHHRIMHVWKGITDRVPEKNDTG